MKITPRQILIRPTDNTNLDPVEVKTYMDADRILNDFCHKIYNSLHFPVHVVTIFCDLFAWKCEIILMKKDFGARNFVQRAIQAEWEFNAGIKPSWWPMDIEAARMWEVHFHEDQDNGRAELARARLDRYDLNPIELNVLPPRPIRSMT